MAPRPCTRPAKISAGRDPEPSVAASLNYRFAGGADEPPTNFYEHALQNSRGFRALKVWLALRQAGRDGYVRMIGDDCRVARAMHEVVCAEPELQSLGHDLSITTWRYAPPELRGDEARLDELNERLLARIQSGGEAYLSNAVVGGRFALRACVVNFRTTAADARALVELTIREGRALVHATAV